MGLLPGNGPQKTVLGLHPTVVISVLCKGFHSGDYGHHMGFQCNVACTSIDIQIICNLFWAMEAICHWIIVGAQYCSLIKKSGYTVEYWIFRTAKKGYLFRGLVNTITHPKLSLTSALPMVFLPWLSRIQPDDHLILFLYVHKLS